MTTTDNPARLPDDLQRNADDLARMIVAFASAGQEAVAERHAKTLTGQLLASAFRIPQPHAPKGEA